MRRKLTWVFVLIFLLGAGLAVLKLTIPLSYKEAALSSPAVEYVKGLQKSGVLNPNKCAVHYLYFNTDYHGEIPNRIRLKAKHLSKNQVRVTLHDPSCSDDSIRSSIDRIYLEHNNDGIWIPIRHEWSHTGRGKFGWTTEPTN